MFKHIQGSLPDLFNNYSIRNFDIPGHVTCQQHKLHTEDPPHKNPSCVKVLFSGIV